MCMAIFQTNASLSALVLRLVLGGVFFAHGAQKAFGLFGGAGFAATMNSMRQNMHMPVIFAFLLIFTEFAGALCIIAGFLTRVFSTGIAVIMIAAIILVHAKSGFFMNWSGDQAAEGFEYHILVLGICAALIITGGGLYSVDRIIWTRSMLK